MEPWVTLLVDSFFTGSIVPGYDDLVFYALLAWQNVPMEPAVAVATLGAAFGAAVNWLLGDALRRQQEKPWFRISRPQLEQISRHARRYGILLLLLTWIPLGGIFSFLAGFFRVKLLILLVMVALGRLGYYSYLVYHGL